MSKITQDGLTGTELHRKNVMIDDQTIKAAKIRGRDNLSAGLRLLAADYIEMLHRHTSRSAKKINSNETNK